MTSVNPFTEFRNGCEIALADALDKILPKVSVPSITFETPPSLQFGELSSSICFELAKKTKKKPIELAEKIAEAVNILPFPLIQSVKAAGEGYINFYMNFAKFSPLTFESIRTLDAEYGYVKADEPRRIIVEHTSVNPIHPIHVGHARNPVLGDALARILRARGHTVFRHYYVDDVGRQTAVIGYGYEKLGKPKPVGKPDHFIGIIYTITSCITEIQRLKREVGKAKESVPAEEVRELQRELDDWASVAVDLEGRFPKLFNQLLNAINKDKNPESKMSSLVREYEAGEEEAKQLIREVCQLCIEGFRETLDRAGIFLDSWDWESSLAWSGDVARTLEQLKKTPYVFRVGNVLEFDATLVRADGTTLYTTRDIPYSLWKLQRAEKVINVVGMEQKLSQLQLKLALYALGYRDQAKNLIHFAYNLVTLPGYTMSSRRGRYVTLDEVMDEAVKRAYEEVSKRSPHLPDKQKRQISDIVGIGAMKYALVEVDPMKSVAFTWDRVLDFEKNSAPYIQYSHARACSILRKASRKPENPDYSLLTNPVEHDITIMLARFPEIFVDAAENLRPNTIADFANTLADKFNTFYTALRVIGAEPAELSDARLALVDATRMVLRNALNLLGIEAPERM